MYYHYPISDHESIWGEKEKAERDLSPKKEVVFILNYWMSATGRFGKIQSMILSFSLTKIGCFINSSKAYLPKQIPGISQLS